MTGIFAVVAGGGTAGHLHPGIAVARALIDSGKQRESIHLFEKFEKVEEWGIVRRLRGRHLTPFGITSV